MRALNILLKEDLEMVLNLENVKDVSFAIEKGIYDATVEKAEVVKTADGRPMLTVGFQITGPKYAGKFIWGNWILEGNGSNLGLPRVKDFVAATSDCNLASVNLDAVVGSAVGKAVKLDVYRYMQKSGDYSGQYANGINKIERA